MKSEFHLQKNLFFLRQLTFTPPPGAPLVNFITATPRQVHRRVPVLLPGPTRERVHAAARRVQLVRGPHVQHRAARVHLDTGCRGDRGQPDGDRVPGQVQAHQPRALVPDRQPGAGRLPDGLVPAGHCRGRLVLPRRVLHT